MLQALNFLLSFFSLLKLLLRHKIKNIFSQQIPALFRTQQLHRFLVDKFKFPLHRYKYRERVINHQFLPALLRLLKGQLCFFTFGYILCHPKHSDNLVLYIDR